MRINNNISSLHTQGALFMNNRAVSKNLEKLSTGLRINRASDDAAGLAVSEGLRTQVRGNEQAKKNALDGISALNIAEGAMDELHNIMQRQRELAIQAATSTYSDTERGYMDQEFQALSAEIDRIIEETNFNGIKLLVGGANPSTRTTNNLADIVSWDRVAEDLARTAIRDSVLATVTIANSVGGDDLATAVALRNRLADNVVNRIVNPAAPGTAPATLYTGLGATDIVAALNAAMNDVFGENHGVVAAGGTHRNLTIGSTAAAINTAPVTGGAIQAELATRGVTLATGAAFAVTRPVFDEETVTVGAGEFNGRHLWIGANDQRGVDSILVDYGNIDRILARIDGANSNNAEAAITAMDASIEQVSQARADIGALVNRLESTITNLTTSIVNQQAAESQIRDVDFASQASKFTTNQILVQSATSMLSQANASTQSVLSLLR